MKSYLQKLAGYNRWANEKLYASCVLLSAEEYFKDRKAFFKSIHGTLNHILVGDRLWLGRFEGRESGITELKQILYPDFESLKSAREQEDLRIISFIEQLDETALINNFDFVTLAGKNSSMILQWLINHLFNHQTHHRGQVHNMLAQAGLEPPAIDLYYFLIQSS